MHRPFKTVLLILILGALACPAHAAGTLIAHYTFDGTAADALGNYGDASMDNTVYEDGGVWINGIYPGDDPSGAWVQTPSITDLDFAAFSVSVEFKMSEAPGDIRPILMCGGLERWLSAYLDTDGRPQLRYNSGHIALTGTEAVSLDAWHVAALTWDGTTATLIIDGQVVGSAELSLNFGNGRSFGAGDGGAGKSFRGHWRDLKIYNGVETSLPAEESSLGAVRLCSASGGSARRHSNRTSSRSNRTGRPRPPRVHTKGVLTLERSAPFSLIS